MFIFFLCLITSTFTTLGIALYFQSQEEAQYFDMKDFSFDNKLEILEAIKELQVDFEMGKLSENEFKSREEEYKKQFLDTMKD